MTLIEIQNIISTLPEFHWVHNCIIDNDTIIIEESYEMSEDEKNTDDCCDVARDNGDIMVCKFPMLEIIEYYCHRNKYAIVHLKHKSN